jgi:REP element-mobilizing transposase RayT
MAMKQVQQSFRFELDKNGQRRGGRRKGAGRTRKGNRDRVSHAKRPYFDKRWPLHVTLRVREGLPPLRHTVCLEVFRQVMQECAEQEGFRVVHWSVQSNHVHMIVEAEDQEALTRGMKRISIRLAKRWNKLWERKGAVFDDSYHFVSLDTPTQVRNALVYVLQSAKRHGVTLRGLLDHCSTAPAFEAWREQGPASSSELYPRAKPSTWGLQKGWLLAKGGRLSVHELPKPKTKPRPTAQPTAKAKSAAKPQARSEAGMPLKKLRKAQ